MTEKIAVLLPAYNEEVTIQKVIADFQKVLPNADIYVYDNMTPLYKEKCVIYMHNLKYGSLLTCNRFTWCLCERLLRVSLSGSVEDLQTCKE